MTTATKQVTTQELLQRLEELEDRVSHLSEPHERIAMHEQRLDGLAQEVRTLRSEVEEFQQY